MESSPQRQTIFTVTAPSRPRFTGAHSVRDNPGRRVTAEPDRTGTPSPQSLEERLNYLCYVLDRIPAQVWTGQDGSLRMTGLDGSLRMTGLDGSLRMTGLDGSLRIRSARCAGRR
ncbi:hypothetical protein ACVHNB_08960 [Streptomyces sp. YJ-C3]